MIKIGERIIDYKDVASVALNNEKVSLAASSRIKVVKTRKAIEEAIKRRQIIYGVTTGIGAFKDTVISENDIRKLQYNLIISHAVGVGDRFDESIVRAMMFIIANYLSKGYSGVRLIVIETLIEMLNKGVHPIVPQKGSVGASGDLAPSAHLILVLMGKGEALYKGKKMNGLLVMKKAGIKPVALEAKEGLALINNTSAMSAVSSLTLLRSKECLDYADVVGAISAQALKATVNAFDERLHSLKPYDGQKIVAQRMRRLLNQSTMIDNKHTQDQYSIRCIPQIHGAVREAFKYVERTINTELNSVTDNPLIFVNENYSMEVISGGNFHGEPVAIAIDTLAIALSEIANISDRRIASLIDPATNKSLPAFLIEKGGVNSGMMVLQYTTAALVSENKVLAHPASVDSIPTSANLEDIVSMGTISARKAYDILKNVQTVLAIEFIVATQAVEFRLKEGLKLSTLTKKYYNLIREKIPFFVDDNIYYPYIKKMIQLMEDNKFINIFL